MQFFEFAFKHKYSLEQNANYLEKVLRKVLNMFHNHSIVLNKIVGF